jgi:hypothetical protein
MGMMKLKTLSFIALVCLSLAVGIGLSILASRQAEIFKQRTETTDGKVIDTTPGDHSTGTVEYWVNGIRYEVRTMATISSSDLGKSVPVHFNPQHPSDANSGNSLPSFGGFLFLIGLLVTFIISILSAVYYWPRVSTNPGN